MRNYLNVRISPDEFKLIQSWHEFNPALIESILKMFIVGLGGDICVSPDCDCSELMEALNDLQVFLGFDDNYELNADGRILENIINRVDARRESL